MGEHDNGHARRSCTSNGASKRRTDEQNSGREERKLHQRDHVEEHSRTIVVPVSCDMVPSGTRQDDSDASLLPRPQLSTQHSYLQHICVLPGNKCSNVSVSIYMMLQSREEVMENVVLYLQLFNEVNSREMEKVDVLDGILDNYVFVLVLGFTVLFQIIIIEYLGTFASTTPLSFIQWFICIFIGFLGMPIAVALKTHVPVEN